MQRQISTHSGKDLHVRPLPLLPYQNNDYMVNEARFNCYYNASSPIISPADIEPFEMICDLNEMRCAERDEK